MSHPGHTMLDLPATGAVVLVALVYTRGWLRTRRSFPSTISARRLGAFMAGLASLWIALGSPLAAQHHALLSVHMLQHVLLMAVAPPLLLLGAPALLLRYGLPSRSARRASQRVFRHPSVQGLQRFLMQPVVCWLAPVAALITWHVPAVFELSVHSRWAHGVQAVSFLVTGLLFWAPVVRWRARLATARPWLLPVYLFTATLPCDALSAFLVFCGRVVYPSYLSGPRPWNVPALDDQELAGALMWVSVTLIYVVPAVVITLQLLSPAHSRAAVRGIGVPSPHLDEPSAARRC